MIHLRETVTDNLGTFVQVWECQPPPPDSMYRVIEETWCGDTRIIRAVEMIRP